MDIKVTLERGEYVKHRAELMKTLKIPKLSDAISALGQPLAQIVFDECDEALKENFGLTPPLDGAGDELWVSPSDLLIGKVVLKPPYTAKHIQALTHQGILNIGRDIEIKFWNEMEMEKERALADQRRHMLDEFEDQLKAEIKLVELREQAACQKEMQRITEEFEARLIEELENLESRLRDEFAELYKEQEIMLREEFGRTLKQEVEKTVQNMTREFLNELDRQKNILASNFKLGLQKAHTQREYDINMEQTKCKESIRQLKHNLECKNIANMMYVLCMERRKCCDEKTAIEKHYEAELEILYNTVKQKDQEIKELTDEKNRQIMEVNLRETCLLEIIRQFQKFINFALRASPTQAEFLLSVEKMMIFELADAVLKSGFKDLTHRDEILPWMTEKICKGQKVSGLEMKDYHDCFNEVSPPIPPDAELGPDDFLPAFKYKEKLYVREDFRNMISQGIEISQSNQLWSKDVEILMDTLKKSVSSINTEVEQDPAVVSKRSSIKPDMASLQTVNFSQIGKVEKEPAILATRCSVELLKKKGSIRYVEQKKTDDECLEGSGDERSQVEENASSIIRDIMLKVSDTSFNIIKRKYSDQQEVASVALSKVE
ncbi:hypothetical protein NQ314_008720, partial [Rhamnusium bicolor]